jgi:hypothetical protein
MKTTYRGYYIDVRDGKRVGVTFTYQMKTHEIMINEKEIKVEKL